MTAPRIGDVPSEARGAEASPSTAPPRLLTVVGNRLASPMGVMTAIPVLVGVVGLFLTFVGQRALRESSLEVAGERMAEQAGMVATSVGDALRQADPLLERMIEIGRAHDPGRPFEPVAHKLLDLMRGRAGVTYLSVSFPDGTFQGAFVDEDGALRFQDSRITAAGPTHVRRYDFGPGETLRLQREEETAYDPRQRGFYQSAVKQGGSVWTEPYTFFSTDHTGITRTAPLFVGEGAARTLHAVVTVDFDVRGLSSQLSHHQFRGTRAVLLARDGVILAYAADGGAPAVRSRAHGVLTYHELNDPVVDALFAAPSGSDVLRAGQRVVAVHGGRHMIALAPIAPELALPWSMAYIAPEEFFLHGMYAHRRASAFIAGVALLFALGVAFLFARSITRVRIEAANARADAVQARKEAKELGSYRLTTCLGKGAMGEVWRAEHRLLARQAAIKLINPALHGKDTPEVRGRFRREAQTLATLRSRNTIELFDYGVAEDGTFFFVMELLDGMDLDTLVERHGAQPVERVVPLLLQAAASLAEAHDRGLVHRDIKPANIYICRAADEVDVVKVLDFGLVLTDEAAPAPAPIDVEAHADALVASGKLTMDGGLMGTPAFIPPEQAQSLPLDGRADLYALACVAVWLLAARPLYQLESPTRLLIAHMMEPVPDLRAILPAAVPDALVKLLTRCLQKQPAQRPASMRAFASELRAVKLDGAWSVEQARTWWETHHQPTETRAELAAAATVVSLS